MTDLESPKKNNDCYFYYYSTCAKGDSCGFRHEPSALGSETICSFWKEGKCVNIHCNFRHMELRKNRKAIPCYWETQPVGCLKAHCPFMHQKPKLNSLEKTSGIHLCSYDWIYNDIQFNPKIFLLKHVYYHQETAGFYLTN
ncbi:unnamed protein product [Callosobruchus maculatus]|nr:unnamed protein product [Callosobruchus maculatus]VEN62496.1 unnamed protein product [Callosobruchus maculatus]